MNWTFRVYSPSGALKNTYTPVNPGGIVDEIRWSLDYTGDCLDGNFSAIPTFMNISPRDIVEVSTPSVVYSGYISELPNRDSKQVQSYSMAPLRQLLYSCHIRHFWVPADFLTDGQDLVSLRKIVDALVPHLPPYVSTTIANSAPTDLGVGTPFVAVGKSIGDILDEVCLLASIDSLGRALVWGVNANRAIFVNREPSNTIDLQSARIDRNARENAENAVTSVIFTFPNAVGFDDTSKRGKYRTTIPGITIDSNIDRGMFSFQMDEPDLIALYGRQTLVIPLPITESLLVTRTLAQQATQSVGVQILTNQTQARTHTGSTTAGNLTAAIASSSNASYVRNLTGEPFVFEIAIIQDAAQVTTSASRWNRSATNTIFASNGVIQSDFIVGIEFRVEQLSQDLTVNATYEYLQAFAPENDIIDNAVFWDRHTYTTSDTGLHSILLGRRALVDYRTPPHDNQVAAFVLRFSQPSTASTDSIRLNSLRVKALNLALLANIALTFFSEPKSYPATVEVDTNLGVGRFATVLNRQNTVVTTQISRVNHVLNINRGYICEYVLDHDPERNAVQLSRLLNIIRNENEARQAVTGVTR